MKTILCIINEHSDVSIDRHVHTEVAYLSKCYKVYVYSLGSSGALASKFRHVLGSRFMQSRGSFLSDIWFLASFLRQRKVDIVQTSALRSDIVGLCCRLVSRSPAVHVAIRHNYLFLERDLYHLAKNLLYLFSVHLVDMNICVARHIQNKLCHRLWVPQTKTCLIVNGVQMIPDADSAQRIRRHLSFVHSRPVLLYAGAFIRRKNLGYLFNALRSVTHPYYCVLAGQGPEKSSLETHLRTYGLQDNVRILPHQPIGGLLSLADIFVLPSQDEGLSLALLEAMQMGIPCVASAIDGNTELITSGVEGLTFSLQDPKSLASAIDSLLYSARLRKVLGTAARKKAAYYTQERMVHSYERLYSQIANHKMKGLLV